MASYRYTGSSVKTAQVHAVSSVLVQALLTNRLTCRFPAHLCFPRKPRWLHSCCHAKCYTVQVVWTFPVYWDDQQKHTDTRSILTIHYRTFILCTLRDVSIQEYKTLGSIDHQYSSQVYGCFPKLTIRMGEFINLFTTLNWQTLIYLSLIFLPKLHIRHCSGSVIAFLQQFQCP